MFKTKSKFIYNPESLSYDKVDGVKWLQKSIIFGLVMIIIGILVGIGSFCWIGVNLIFDEESGMWVMPSKHDMIIGSSEWKDSVFTDYQVRADLYLARDEFTGTPIKGDILALAAWNAYDSTGILLPVELCLAQCQWESGMGLKGRSPVNNPFNIGEYDSGTVMWFDNTFEGTQAYFYFMCNDYLSCKPLAELFKNFTNCNGKRYASGEYEKHVPPQYYYIKRWLNKEIKRKKKTTK